MSILDWILQNLTTLLGWACLLFVFIVKKPHDREDQIRNDAFLTKIDQLSVTLCELKESIMRLTEKLNDNKERIIKLENTTDEHTRRLIDLENDVKYYHRGVPTDAKD